MLGLQIVFLVGNFLSGVGLTLMAPMILARTGNGELIFGSVQSLGAVGGVAGGLVMSLWVGLNDWCTVCCWVGWEPAFWAKCSWGWVGAWWSGPPQPSFSRFLYPSSTVPTRPSGKPRWRPPCMGTGPGAGMSLILIFSGLPAILVSVGGYLAPIVRNAEDPLADTWL